MRPVERIEPALSLASKALGQGEPAVARKALAAAHALLTALRHSDCEVYDPAKALEAALRPLEDSSHRVRVEPLPACRGDLDQVGAIAAMLMSASELSPDSVVAAEGFSEDGLPQVTISLDGPGSFPERMYPFGVLPVSYEELGPAWTRATDGGRVDRTSYGLRMTLSGMREPGQGEDALYEAGALVAKARDTLEGEAVRKALEHIDAAEEQQPAALPALIDRVLSERSRDLAAKAIKFETLHEPGLPAIPVYRNRFERFLHSLADLAMASAPEAAEAVIMAAYDTGACVASLSVELPVRSANLAARACLASMQRAAAETHSGEFEADWTAAGLTIQAAFPDPVGTALHAWLPGYTAFGEESVRMLRLLKGGGPAPPEAFVLGGVLENELERRMLPPLSSQLARNIAHEISDQSTLPGGSSERLRKALGQIRKGKPRKEVARPPYAGELLWAFSGGERERQAVGLSHLSKEELQKLALPAAGVEPDPIGALRILAKSGPPATP